jgi:CRISPR-associated endonuclease/helicase Cas3
MEEITHFDRHFWALTGSSPFRWQRRMFRRLVKGDIPSCCDLPTGLGKTSVMTIWLIARARNPDLPRRLVYVVDRRAVVDQATEVAEELKRRLKEEPDLSSLVQDLRLDPEDGLPISTLRGQHADNRLWLKDPSRPAIVVGTVDMVGSRLLFSGYGVSPQMRPYQAGLLGADTLVVLDEAHLCPPFEALLKTIADDEGNAFGSTGGEMHGLMPPFRLLSLSATGRGDPGGEAVFRLEPKDHEDPVVIQRLAAVKRLKLDEPRRAQKLPAALAERAIELAPPEAPRRVLIYCDRRVDAQAVKEAIDKQSKKQAGEPISELLVGARRVHERTKLASWLKAHGFLGGAEEDAPDRPTFLVATSAGEVGIDLDADHLVSDLVTWERMVQRLGRVNRRGEKTSRVEVISAPRERETPEAWLKRLSCLRRPLEMLPPGEDGARDASPGALVALKQAGADSRIKEATDAATTQEPLRPALTRALVDAWSLTSIAEHTGRPDVQPWLRGWVSEEPQTAVVWRRWLPWPEDLEEPIVEDVNGFFAAGPPDLEEMLETETHRVIDVLVRRATTANEAALKAGAIEGRLALEQASPALILLGRDLRLRGCFTLRALAELKDNRRRRERAFADMIGAIVVVNAGLGGLDDDGLLDAASDAPAETLDGGWGEDVLARIGYRIVGPGEPEPDPRVWKRAETIRLGSPEEDEDDAGQGLEVYVLRTSDAPARGDLAIASRPQPLDEHHVWAGEEARQLAEALDLSPNFRNMLIAAARVHDGGKDRALWQTAMNAPRDGHGPYAKTAGGGDGRRLAGYRHEFGSLADAEKGVALDDLDPDLRDLALHLIAAHHGHGRPTITPHDPGRPGQWESRAAQDERAREAALRFARLQRRYGPWRLAWLEALLRAADWRASARHEAAQRNGQRPEAAD